MSGLELDGQPASRRDILRHEFRPLKPGGVKAAFGREAMDTLDPDSTTLIKVIRIRGTALSAASDKQGRRDSTQ